MPIAATAIYPAFSKLSYIWSNFIKSPEVNLKAITPIKAPVITKRNWSLIATAAVILSIEKARSVNDNNKITFNNEILELVLISFFY